MAHAEGILHLADGKIVCRRCTGTSRRTRLQCAAPAERHSNKCRFHGSRGVGPATEEGLKRCAAAKTIHGQESRASRKRTQLQMRLIRSLKQLGVFLASNPTDGQIAMSPLIELVFENLFALDEYDLSG